MRVHVCVERGMEEEGGDGGEGGGGRGEGGGGGGGGSLGKGKKCRIRGVGILPPQDVLPSLKQTQPNSVSVSRALVPLS